MERIIISGVNGFLGSHLTDFCISKNYEVYGLERPNQIYRNLSHYTDEKLIFSENEKKDFFNENIEIQTTNRNLKILECDIKNALLLEKIITEINPKYIFHFGAQPLVIPSWEDPVATIETNVIGTINIFEAIKK